MVCCLNPECDSPLNSDFSRFCQRCGAVLVPILRNRYRVIQPIGRGGFAVTYLAEDTDKLNESCVVKQLDYSTIQGYGDFQQIKRLFEQEARQLQQLGEHPQIPRLLAYFEEGNCLYLVQPFIEGQNLRQELESHGPCTEKESQNFLLSLLPVLQFIHDRGIIHRDLKPENIMRRSVDQKLVLIDFGVTKQKTGHPETQRGTAIGSYGYAAPEQMQGGDILPASDLYSLGATCFHLLTGRDPGDLWEDQGYGWLTNWQEYLKQPLSKDLQRILGKLLQKNIHQRYPSATAVLSDLQPQQPEITEVSYFSAPSLTRRPSVPPTVFSARPTVRFGADQADTPSHSSSSQAKKQTQSNLVSHSEAFAPTRLRFSPKSQISFKWVLSGLAAIAVLSMGVGAWSLQGKVWQNLISRPSFGSHLSLMTRLAGHTGRIRAVAFNPDGKTFASGSWDESITLWNLDSGRKLYTLTRTATGVLSLAFSPDGETLASDSWDKTIKLWHVKSGKLLHTLSGHSDDILALDFSPDGHTLASGSWDRTIKLWDVGNGKSLQTLNGHAKGVLSVAFSPSGKQLVSGGSDNDKLVRLWDVATGRSLRAIAGHNKGIPCIVFSPDGKTIASGSWDTTIKLWDTETGQLLQTLTGHTKGVISLAFSPDGQMLASVSRDKTVKLWNVQTYRLIQSFSDAGDDFLSVTFNSGGKAIISSTNQRTIRIWEAPSAITQKSKPKGITVRAPKAKLREKAQEL
jgi:WD40 repeat protein